MNFVNPYIFAPPVDLTTNTEIGGVASTISTAALLATKLGIDVSRITNFAIVGSDIKCRITGSYTVRGFDFNGTPCTYYKDTDYLVTALGYWAFYNTYNFQGYDVDFQNCLTVDTSALSRVYANRFLLKNVTSIADNGFWQSSVATVFYIPNCTSLGSTVGNNSVFTDINPSAKIYCNPSLATNNGGTPDGDLAYAISQGATVIYVTNFTAPNPVTDLSAGTIYNTAIQLNFTPPSSTNAIDYYECYANGVLKNTITGSGQYITGLATSTNYNITIKAVDIFYNKSVLSNSLSVSTIDSSSIIGLYENRVYADGGATVNPGYLTTEYSKITSQFLESYLLSWHNYKSGMKKDGSDKIEKMYSFVDSNFDVVQTTAANKPTYTASGITFDLTDALSKTLSPVVTNKTFSIVWRLKSTPGNYYPGVNLGGWDSFTMHSASGGNIYSGITVANRFNLGSGSFLTNTDATYTFTYNSVTKQANIYRNTTLLGTKTMVDPINWTSFSFDAQNGTFYDIKVFSKDLSLTEITNIL